MFNCTYMQQIVLQNVFIQIYATNSIAKCVRPL